MMMTVFTHRSLIRPSRSSKVLLAIAPLMLATTAAFAEISEIRSYDGSGNNLTFPSRGATYTPLMRLTAPIYPDGMGEQLMNWPNARTVSNAVSAQTSDTPNSRGMSGFVWQWGQFLDHDISLTPSSATNGTAHIMLADNDPLAPMIPLNRSNYSAGTGETVGNPRQQINEITTYIDASNIYGSDAQRAAELRAFADGKLIESDAHLMPIDNGGNFMSGDVRANEQLALVAMHTLFMREHNRVASAIAVNATDLPSDATERDEQIYQRARKIIGAQMQAITYNEFLPALLGDRAPGMSTATYDPSVNPTIANEFSTAFYRFGHSMLPHELKLVDNEGRVTETIALRDAFFQPDMMVIKPDRIGQILKGLATEPSQEIDTQVVDEVRNFLMLDMMPMGLDLAALNIQRGRDHGIAGYNELRRALGLQPATDFDDVTSDAELSAALAQTYTNVESVDAWVGALAEDHVPGTSVGELVLTSLVDQFTRLRDGDRFFYLFDPDIPSLEIEARVDLESITLRDVIVANTSIDNLQTNVFFVPEPSGVTLAFIGLLFVRRRKHNGNRLNPSGPECPWVVGCAGSGQPGELD